MACEDDLAECRTQFLKCQEQYIELQTKYNKVLKERNDLGDSYAALRARVITELTRRKRAFDYISSVLLDMGNTASVDQAKWDDTIKPEVQRTRAIAEDEGASLGNERICLYNPDTGAYQWYYIASGAWGGGCFSGA